MQTDYQKPAQTFLIGDLVVIPKLQDDVWIGTMIGRVNKDNGDGTYAVVCPECRDTVNFKVTTFVHIVKEADMTLLDRGEPLT